MIEQAAPILATNNPMFRNQERVIRDDKDIVTTLFELPKPGRVAIFQHKVHHEGCVVRRGTKYAMRTDVLYEI